MRDDLYAVAKVRWADDISRLRMYDVARARLTTVGSQIVRDRAGRAVRDQMQRPRILPHKLRPLQV